MSYLFPLSRFNLASSTAGIWTLHFIQELQVSSQCNQSFRCTLLFRNFGNLIASTNYSLEAPEIPHVDHVGFDLMLERSTKILTALAQRWVTENARCLAELACNQILYQMSAMNSFEWHRYARKVIPRLMCLPSDISEFTHVYSSDDHLASAATSFLQLTDYSYFFRSFMIVMQTHLNTRIVDFLEGVSQLSCHTDRYQIRREFSLDDLSIDLCRVTCQSSDNQSSAVVTVLWFEESVYIRLEHDGNVFCTSAIEKCPSVVWKAASTHHTHLCHSLLFSCCAVLLSFNIVGSSSIRESPLPWDQHDSL